MKSSDKNFKISCIWIYINPINRIQPTWFHVPQAMKTACPNMAWHVDRVTYSTSCEFHSPLKTSSLLATYSSSQKKVHWTCFLSVTLSSFKIFLTSQYTSLKLCEPHTKFSKEHFMPSKLSGQERMRVFIWLFWA